MTSKTRRGSQKAEEPKLDLEALSIWGQMVTEAQAKKDEAGGEQPDVVVLFCGKKRSGKTSLIERFINPQKEVGDQPRPTVALDYKYARYASEASSMKSLAHVYDLGGDESQFGDLVAVVITPETVERLVLVVTLDLSEPGSVLPSLTHWLEMLRTHVEKCLDSITSTEKNGAKRVAALRAARKEAFDKHPDAVVVRPMAVPLVILGTKWDVFVTETDAEKRKWLCRALRLHAHVHGAYLLCTSTTEKASLNAMRSVLRGFFFGGFSRGQAPAEQFDHSSKPIHIPVAKDSIEQIGPAGSQGRNGEADWAALIEEIFPKSLEHKKASQDVREVSEELASHNESAIDGMVEQKSEELNQYRRQAERNQRLASEGIDAKRVLAV